MGKEVRGEGVANKCDFSCRRRDAMSLLGGVCSRRIQKRVVGEEEQRERARWIARGNKLL